MGDWTAFVQPWDWPLHLCNLAMVLVCVNLIFLPKKLFYFTYFINVFGAVLAMLMPNYDEALTVFNPSVVHFWCNHMIAFWMPLLCVALKLFERPKLKQYTYSMIAFTGYFILVFICNTVFTAYQGTVVHYLGRDFTICETDFFFINSTFIAEKMGNWAEKLFNINVVVPINGREFTIHPVYQTIYLFAYVLLGFGVWFVYQLFFDIADSHNDLHIRLKGIRLDKLALQNSLQGRSLDEPMDKEAGTQLKLDHFSKRYSGNNYYAVQDANLVVEAGEVFGFLGPNGAGKTTTFYMVVGLVNSGIMNLSQTVSVIIGANVGTTITSWMLSLTGIEGSTIWLKLLKPSSFSPVLAAIGIILVMASKGESKKKDVGGILLGFAILMFGMETMSGSVSGLAGNSSFTQLMTAFSNPILGMTVGAVLTAVIQSSSASVGILQALCATGAVHYSVALPIIMGQNIGTCVTSIISSVGANKNARRAAMVHLYFNLIGTILFMLVFYLLNVFVEFACDSEH